MTVDIEATIKETHTYAQKYFDLLRKQYEEGEPLPDGEPEHQWKATVEISVGFHRGYYHGEVLPSYMMFGCEWGHLMKKGTGGKSIGNTLTKMLKGTKEEYETFRDTNMVPSIGCHNK